MVIGPSSLIVILLQMEENTDIIGEPRLERIHPPGEQTMNERKQRASRREFLQTSAAAMVTGALAQGVHAQGSDVIKVGLVGCGGRGTGAATQAMNADK